MSIDNQDKLNLIQYRLDEAMDTQSDVELLIDNGRLRAAVNRIYYGMFYSLLALAIKSGFETSKHSQLIGWFNKTFILEGLLDPKYGKIINKAYNRRSKSDYDSFVEFDLGAVKEMFEDMKDFIKEIEQFINKSDPENK
jgi:uncharacterized protein (UPF0332 family)